MPFILVGIMIALSLSLGVVTVDPVADADAVAVRTLAAAAGGLQVWVAPCAAPGTLGAFAKAVATELAAGDAALNVTCRDCEAPAVCADSVLGAWASEYGSTFAAVVFDAPLVAGTGGGVDAPAAYRLRLDSARARGAGGTNSTPAFDADGSPAPPDGTPATYVGSVLPLQAAVDAAIGRVAAAATAGAPPPPPAFALGAKPFPSLGYTIDIGTTALSSIVPIYMTLIFSLLVRGGLTRILVEKARVTAADRGRLAARVWSDREQ